MKTEIIIETKVSTTNDRYRMQLVQLGSRFYTRCVITGHNGRDMNMQYNGKSHSKKGYQSVDSLKVYSQHWKNF